MKKAIIYSVFILGILTFTVLPSTGQEYTNFKLTRKVSILPDSETTEIKVKCKENLKIFNIAIEASIYKGNLKIEILNPSKKKIDSFDIESHIPKDTKSQPVTGWESNEVRGQISKRFDNPISGDWIVRIIPDNVLGNVNIASSTNYETN